ncbi:hypothetical protein [Mycolicibacterium gadium]|uniref:Uncharacterized protein n=1 Tax=Mycolicibacterium gadium TaxID=1794 RepID=A0A7I7WWJ6_MYCGU|nr:hypothetical protein [Mycolicibacterium gadium]BBZ20871.1 hypothetical protein MGAD_52060 [Mycolicibacterium gadium]
MKTIIMTTVLSVIGFAYLALCAYGISRTGSAEGLADIGNTRLLGVVAIGLAVATGVRKK